MASNSYADVVPGLRDLDFRHLVALDAVATEGTFAKAAMRLGYTQSAVSQQIAALERLVGDKLFDRPGGPRPVELTPLGKVVLGHARDILTRVDAAGDAVERFRAGEAGRVDVGTFQSVSNVLLPAIVKQLRAEHDLAERGQLDGSRTAGTVEELVADEPLQRRDLLADGGLGVAEALSLIHI